MSNTQSSQIPKSYEKVKDIFSIDTIRPTQPEDKATYESRVYKVTEQFTNYVESLKQNTNNSNIDLSTLECFAKYIPFQFVEKEKKYNSTQELEMSEEKIEEVSNLILERFKKSNG